jgi:excisionase family DNA binding protein
MAGETQERLLHTIPQVAELTNYSRSFIYLAISSGKLRVLRKGRTVRVSDDDLADWLASDE